jgi:hypothetical protein
MALKNIYRLTKRRQGELVGQIYKTICCYSDFFVARSRVYLKEVAQNPDSVYWLENTKTGDITSMALVEPKYRLQIDGLDIVTIGHTISKVANQIQNILDHIFGDYSESNIIILSRESFAKAMMLEEKHRFVSLDSEKLNQLWPNLAALHSDYFNISNGEPLVNGLARKGYKMYLRIQEVQVPKVEAFSPELAKMITEKWHEEIKIEAEEEMIR